MMATAWKSIGRLRGIAHPTRKQLEGRAHNGRDLRSGPAVQNVVTQLSSGRVPFLFEHGTQQGFGPDKPIGRVASARETHAGGIEVEIELGPAGCPEAERAAEMLRNKTHTELSLAHAYEQLDESQPIGNGEYRHDVLEVSLVKDGGRRDCTIGQWTEATGQVSDTDQGMIAASLLTIYKKDTSTGSLKGRREEQTEYDCYKGPSAKKVADSGVVLSSLQTMSDPPETSPTAPAEATPTKTNQSEANSAIAEAAPADGSAFDARSNDVPAPEKAENADANDAAGKDADFTPADFQELCGLAEEQQRQVHELKAQLEVAQKQASEEKKTAEAASAALETHKAKLVADSKRKAKETLQALRKKLGVESSPFPVKGASLTATEEGAPSESKESTNAMEVDSGLVTDSLQRINDLELKLEQSQSALKRFVDPQKANMMGTGSHAHLAKRQKLDNNNNFPAPTDSKNIERKAAADRGIVTASRLGYEEEDQDICAVRDNSIVAVREGKLDMREFNQRMAQLHSTMGLQANDGGVVRANSDRYRADGIPDGPLGLEFGYNLRDQNPEMCTRLQGLVNGRNARDLIQGAQTTLHHTQRYAQRIY